MDLGSRPWQVLRDITLPVISPAIVSGWLLAFTISLDDVVITSFTTGPGATTLPILDLEQGQARCDARHQCAGHHHHRGGWHRCGDFRLSHAPGRQDQRERDIQMAIAANK